MTRFLLLVGNCPALTRFDSRRRFCRFWGFWRLSHVAGEAEVTVLQRLHRIASLIVVSWLTPNRMGPKNILRALTLGINTSIMTAILLVAIQIGGIGGMAPNRQGDLSKLGFRALVAATLACQ